MATARGQGTYTSTCAHESWKEGDPWPPVQTDSEEEEEAQEQASEEEDEKGDSEEEGNGAKRRTA